jgi:hypothetical protein
MIMKTAKQVEKKIEKMKAKGIPLAEAAWKTALYCVGWPYIFGDRGQYCTPAHRKAAYASKGAEHPTIKSKCKNFQGTGSCSGCQFYPGGQTRAFDCRGFTYWVLLQIYGWKLMGAGATSQWNTASNWKSKGEIKDMPKDTLVCLFVQKGKTMEHTGFGLNNETVECSSGVQHFTTRNKKWTHWGIPACVDGTITTTTPDEDDDEDQDVGFPDPSPRRLSIRRGDKGDDVKECQTMLKALGYDLGKCGIDGDYGSMTRLAVICFQRDHGLVADGICGPLTWDALDTAFKASAGTPVTSTNTYSVIIRGLDQTQAQALAANYPASSEIVEGE